MAIHAMIDLETLDTKPSCTILSLGAVKFNPMSDAEPHSEMYFKFNIDEQSQRGRTVSEDTIAWWAQQDKKVQDEAFSEQGRSGLEFIATELTKWIHNTDVIWGHGYGFDITILEDFFRMMGKPIPWQFWQVRDSRTLFTAMKNGDPRKGMQTDLHNALADAYYQAKSVQMAYKELGINR